VMMRPVYGGARLNQSGAKRGESDFLQA
jgi:hypothetical protein